jgi:hypothetical protein
MIDRRKVPADYSCRSCLFRGQESQAGLSSITNWPDYSQKNSSFFSLYFWVFLGDAGAIFQVASFLARRMHIEKTSHIS